MAIRQQYVNEELVHKLRSMLDDLPTLRTRAIKKLEHWREAAVKRLLARQRELEKTLLDKFERLEFDTQLFVEKTARKKAQQQRRWQSEPFDFLNKSEIDRISTNLRSIREELEKSKLILAGSTVKENVGENLSSKTAIHETYDLSSTSNDLGLELKRVLEICTSPQYSAGDELSPLQPLDHAEYAYDAKSKQTTAKTSTTYQPKHDIQIDDPTNRRQSRLITNIPIESVGNNQNEIPSNNNPKLFSFESFDESISRFEKLCDVRKTLRNKYDDYTEESIPVSKPVRNDDMQRTLHIEDENVVFQPTDPTILQLYDQAATSVNTTQDPRYRSRTLEVHQLHAVDNQIYGCSSPKPKQQAQHRSHSHKHRSNRLSLRRLSDDKQSMNNNSNETWLDVGQEHWGNLLGNGWRPTVNTSGVNLVSIIDSDNYGTRKRKQEHDQITAVIDLYEQVSRNEYVSLFDQLDFAYSRTIDLGNEFWRFLEISGNHHLCLYHQLNKQFILFHPDSSLLSFPWPYDGIVDISWSKTTNTWIIATQTQIIIRNHSFSKILKSINISGDWPKRITSCRSSIFHTYKIPVSSISSSTNSSYRRLPTKDRPQFLLERYDYKLNSIGKHILESSTIWDIEADDLTEHVAVLCDVALLIFDYQLNLLRQIEVTGFNVSKDHFGGWLIADYNASCIWQIRRNEYLKANKILHVERPWSVILDQSTWTIITLSETQNRAKRLLFFSMKNIPLSLTNTDSSLAQSQLSNSLSSSTDSLL